MGGDRNHEELGNLIDQCRKIWPHIKYAMYSGKQFDEQMASHLDYYKVGPYMPEFGPLNKPTTNQVFYKRYDNYAWENITYRFYDKTE